MKFTVGALYVPVPELVTFVLAVAISLAIWAAMRYTDLGRASRAALDHHAQRLQFDLSEQPLTECGLLFAVVDPL